MAHEADCEAGPFEVLEPRLTGFVTPGTVAMSSAFSPTAWRKPCVRTSFTNCPAISIRSFRNRLSWIFQLGLFLFTRLPLDRNRLARQ